tara:strand:- start:299 stop:736 length:438 start_codon:yes stop_codon:yes gene_type:complete
MAGQKLSQRQIVAKIEPVEAASPRLEGYFAQVSGGEITASVEKVYDGGQRFPETLCAPADIGDITVTRHYESERDGAKLEILRPLVGQAYYNVTITELNCDLEVANTRRIYTEALCVGMTEPDGDASSGAPASFSLTFSIGPLAS